MPFLIVLVVLVGLLCALDLILTLGVIKRLREHTELLSQRGGPGVPALQVGEEVGEFTTSTVDGAALRRAHLAGETLVGFFSPSCPPCKEKLPSFVEFARGMPRDQVLTAVIGDLDDASATVAALSPVARVVVENHDGPLSSAFKANAYPTVLTVAANGAGRLVVTSDHVELKRPDIVAV